MYVSEFPPTATRAVLAHVLDHTFCLINVYARWKKRVFEGKGPGKQPRRRAGLIMKAVFVRRNPALEVKKEYIQIVMVEG